MIKKNEDQGANEIILKNVCDETGERSKILPNSVLAGKTRLPESGREIHTHVSPSLFNDTTRTNLLMRLIIAVSAARRG